MPSDNEGTATPPAEEVPAGRPLRKRAKKDETPAEPAETPNAVRRRRKRFWLNMLPDMPLDIILEVSNHRWPRIRLSNGLQDLWSLAARRPAEPRTQLEVVALASDAPLCNDDMEGCPQQCPRSPGLPCVPVRACVCRAYVQL